MAELDRRRRGRRDRVQGRRAAAQVRLRDRVRLRGKCSKYTRLSRDERDAKLRSDAHVQLDNRSPDVTIDIPDIERGVVDEFQGLSVDVSVRDRLLETRATLAGSAPLVLYSDGSLIKVGTPEVGMAFGVVRELDGGRCATLVSGRVGGFASSTKAELVGLLAAILVSPRDVDVDIRIDNSAVVSQFQPQVVHRLARTARQRTRTPYMVWWVAIWKAYVDQGKRVTVTWVRGHAGQAGNEGADRAAKAAHDNGAREWDLNLEATCGAMSYASFLGTVAEDDLRTIVKRQGVIRHNVRWRNQNRTKASIRNFDDVDWRATLGIIHDNNFPGSRFTSVSDCRRRAHRMKKLHGMLPTLSVLHERRPDLYRNPLCRRCLLDVEDQTHLWHCRETVDAQWEGWNEVMEKLNDIGERACSRAKTKWKERKEKAEAEGKRYLAPSPKFFSAMRRDIWRSLAFVKGLEAVQDGRADGVCERPPGLADDEEDREWWIDDLYQGLVPKSLGRQWKTLFKTTAGVARYMAARFVGMVEDFGRVQIWNARCEATIDWEKSIGITPASKRKPGSGGTGDPTVGNRVRQWGFAPDGSQERVSSQLTADWKRSADERLLLKYLGQDCLSEVERTGRLVSLLVEDSG